MGEHPAKKKGFMGNELGFSLKKKNLGGKKKKEQGKGS